jgi:hypothetical protein
MWWRLASKKTLVHARTLVLSYRIVVVNGFNNNLSDNSPLPAATSHGHSADVTRPKSVRLPMLGISVAIACPTGQPTTASSCTSNSTGDSNSKRHRLSNMTSTMPHTAPQLYTIHFSQQKVSRRFSPFDVYCICYSHACYYPNLCLQVQGMPLISSKTSQCSLTVVCLCCCHCQYPKEITTLFIKGQPPMCAAVY